MFERDDDDITGDPSSLEVLVARERAAPPAIRDALRVAHAHGVRAILARARAREAAPPGESSAGPLDAVA
jgi:hypothetical protein